VDRRHANGRNRTVLHVTEEALAHAAYQLGQSDEAGDVILRLSAHEGGLILRPGRVEPDDVIFEHDGQPVIAVGKDLNEQLGSVMLQAEQTAGETRLQLRERG
jgi:hypothetical protein